MMPQSRAQDRLIVIGGASIDTLHLSGGTVKSAGGAGLYSALAALRAGARVTMLAPRPAPVPTQLTAAVELLDWQGREVSSEDLPHFDISYNRESRRTLHVERPGSESGMDPERIVRALPPGPVYVIPLTDSRLQLEFVRRLKAQGRWVACGTYTCGARDQGEAIRTAFETADASFCNEEEAEILFGGPDARTWAGTRAGKLLFVTRGRQGVRVYQGSHQTEVPAVQAIEVDPTGAGDAFCGAALAALMAGKHPVMAARQGAAVAARTVGDIGPAALLDPAPLSGYPVDRRLGLDAGRIADVARWLASAPELVGFDFCGESFPESGEALALDYFFAQTLQQFGFWRADDGRYREPMIAPAGGRQRKGSDYLWFVYRRLMERDSQALTPARHRTVERHELDLWYRSDEGVNPVPASDLHWRLARRYGDDLAVMATSPAALLEQANASDRPAAALLQLLDHVGGYKEDSLRKKSALLALVLRQRPERFLRSVEGDDLPPIVDYHIQRSCLRTGLVTVEDSELERHLAERLVLGSQDEAAVREACYRAVAEVQEASGKPMAAVDWFFFQNRRRCPEMSEPDCSSCEIETVCAQRKDLFQPVFRTSFY